MSEFNCSFYCAPSLRWDSHSSPFVVVIPGLWPLVTTIATQQTTTLRDPLSARQHDPPLGTTRSPGTIVPPAIASLRPPSAASRSQTSFPPRFGNRVVSQLRNPLVSPKKPLPPNSLAWNQTYGLAMSALCMQMAATKKVQFDSQAWAHQGRGSRFLVG